MTDPVKAQVPRLAVAGIYGPDRFGRAAERIVRLFGMSRFLVGQTVVIAAWVIVSKTGFGPRFDPYPFIFLNMVFSALAAYAAQLILLAETRQADRDKILAKTEARHRAGADSGWPKITVGGRRRPLSPVSKALVLSNAKVSRLPCFGRGSGGPARRTRMSRDLVTETAAAYLGSPQRRRRTQVCRDTRRVPA